MADRAVIVGSGIFGTTAALELRRRGWQVTLLDQGAIPHPKATSNDLNRVIRADYGADDFFVDLGLEAIARWREWNETWDEPPYHEDGFLLLSPGELAPGGYEGDSYDRLITRGVPLETLTPSEVRARFPAWNPGDYTAAYFNPRAGWVESDRVLRTLLARARADGVSLLPHTGISGLLEASGRVTGVKTARGEGVEGDVVVIAAGPWTPRLLPWLSDVMWPSGQPILYLLPGDPEAWRPPRFTPWCADIARSGWYGISALPDDRVKVAHHGEGQRVDPAASSSSRPARYRHSASSWRGRSPAWRRLRSPARESACTATPGMATSGSTAIRNARASLSLQGGAGTGSSSPRCWARSRPT